MASTTETPKLVRPSRKHLPHNALPMAVLTAIWTGAVVVLGLWWGGSPAGPSGSGAWLTESGRITGLLAGYAAPVLILLMARLPFLERGVGADRLARWHAMGGRYLTGLLLAHIVLIIWGYSVTRKKGLLGETVEVVFHTPDMLKATFGTLLLFVVAFTSARAARRRLSYEAWYYVHLGTYVAIALTFAHQLSDGVQFFAHPLARYAWLTLYFGTVLIIFWFRLLVPFRVNRRHRLRVVKVEQEGPGIISVYVTGRHLNRLRAESGQFFRLQFMTPGLRWVANPYSLSAPANTRHLRFTVKALGSHSAAVASLEPGTAVRAEGPYGAFTATRRRSQKVLLLAAGVGITPIRALFETLPAGPGDLTLLYRASNEEDLLFRPELEEIAVARGADLHYLVGSRDTVGDPLTTENLKRLVPDLAHHDVYLCGPEALTAAAAEALRTAGVARGRIHYESFTF